MIDGIKKYITDQVSLVKLEGTEAVGRMVSQLVYGLILGIFALFFVLILSFAAAFYLGTLYGVTIGFLFVTGFYLLLIFFALIFRKSIKTALLNIFISAASVTVDDE